jgi:hypothetical protein
MGELHLCMAAPRKKGERHGAIETGELHSKRSMWPELTPDQVAMFPKPCIIPHDDTEMHEM